jgi:hypothetical protein
MENSDDGQSERISMRLRTAGDMAAERDAPGLQQRRAAGFAIEPRGFVPIGMPTA